MRLLLAAFVLGVTVLPAQTYATFMAVAAKKRDAEKMRDVLFKNGQYREKP